MIALKFRNKIVNFWQKLNNLNPSFNNFKRNVLKLRTSNQKLLKGKQDNTNKAKEKCKYKLSKRKYSLSKIVRKLSITKCWKISNLKTWFVKKHKSRLLKLKLEPNLLLSKLSILNLFLNRPRERRRKKDRRFDST